MLRNVFLLFWFLPCTDMHPGEGNGYPLQYSFLGIQWTKETGRLQSMGLQRVRHNLAIEQLLLQIGKDYRKLLGRGDNQNLKIKEESAR